MAMYCQGSSEIQADALQTICLMNPNCVGYSDTHHQAQPNMLFLNSSTTAVHGLNSTVSPHAPLHQARQFWGIPLSHDTSRPPSVLGWQEDIQAAPHSSISSFRCNPWGLDVDTAKQANMPQQTPHALSLGLAPHQTGFDKPLPSRHHQDFLRKKCSSPSLTTIDLSKGVNLMPSVIIGSKYIKAAQELLDEVANVVDRKGTAIDRPEGSRDKAKIIKETAANASSGGGDHSGNKGGGAELSTAQRQEIQVKKAKLNCLLDEVEQRSRMYHHQMQTVVASFEQAAGIGSAKSYTQLALKTILKQFRRLKSAISWQIKALKKSLGEEECSGGKLGGSRLGFLDHQLRQLGTMQNNAWRPHRGLPERAVSVLRAWLFDHFLHPYPKDSDKQRLATQTGLTKSQVSNWFINARVRLWKPTVEEMYQEETKNQVQHISSQENAPKAGSDRESGSKQNAPPDNINSRTPAADQHKTLQTKQGKLMLDLQVPSPTEISASTVVAASPTGPSLRPHPGFAQLNIGSIYMENLEKNAKKPRSGAQDESPGGVILPGDMEKKAGRITESYLSMAAPNTNLSPGTGFGAYGLCEPGRFNADPQQLATGFQENNFSLTLGLPPSETSQGARQHSFLSARNFGTRIETGAAESSRIINGINQFPSAASHPNAGYEILDFHDRRPFPSQFLPDFMA